MMLPLTGWICPKCGRCYSPTTPMCLYCSGGTVRDVEKTGERQVWRSPAMNAVLDVIERVDETATITAPALLNEITVKVGHKAEGNSMAVPVMAWIGQRIEMVRLILARQAEAA